MIYLSLKLNTLCLGLDKMLKENREYTYSGVFKTLVYWYEVKHGDIEKSNFGLGIVPYIYQDAFRYYKALWETQQRNSNKNIADFMFFIYHHEYNISNLS